MLSGDSKLLSRTTLAACLGVVALLCAFVFASPSLAGTQTFGATTQSAQTFTVPDGVNYLQFQLWGGDGGSGVSGPRSQGGESAETEGILQVTPGQVLNVYVGQYGSGKGGWGWASGGDHGTTPGISEGNDGSGGGGASAIIAADGSRILAVAGAGGGAGGDDDEDNHLRFGGSGGNGSATGGAGSPGLLKNGSPSDRAGGCGGCRNVGTGYEGESTTFGQSGAGGGGGGGGYQGGGGGANGNCCENDEAAGSGGGGGSSYIVPDALDPSISTRDNGCTMTSQGGSDLNCYGGAVFTWAGAPQNVTLQSGDNQSAEVDAPFANSLTVKVTDATGIPVPGLNVLFSAADDGPTAFFSRSIFGGATSTTAETDTNGLATAPPPTASGEAGPWTGTITATQSGVATTFSMTNTPAGSTTTVSTNPDPAYFSQEIDVSAVVTSTTPSIPATGNAQFSFDGIPAGPPVPIAAGNKATLPVGQVPALSVGNHAVTAAYLGDDGHTGSQDTESQTVTKTPTSAAVTSTPNPSDSGENVDLTARISKISGASGTPSGQVEFRDSNAVLLGTSTLDSSGEAQLSTDDLETGTITATYDGDAQFAASSARYSQSVGPEATATVISTSQNPALYGFQPTWTAQVSRTDQGAALAGTVAFEVDGTVVCPAVEVNAQGQATCSPVTPLDAGKREIDATYVPPDGSGDLPSSGSLDQVVVAAPSQTVGSLSPEPSVFGDPVLIQVGVTLPDNPGTVAAGNASILIDGINAGSQALAGGSASISESCPSAGNCKFDAGSHSVEADYLPSDANTLASDAVLHHQVTAAPTTTAVESSADPSGTGSSVSFTASVTSSPNAGSPTGLVSFLVDGAAVGSAVPLSGGKATSSPISTLTAGEHEITARYLGSANLGPSQASLQQQVNQTPDPVRAKPVFRFRGSNVRLRGRKPMKVRMICEGDRGAVCRGVAVMRNRKPLRVARAAGKRTRKIRPGKLMSRRTFTLKAGDTITKPFRLNGFGRKVLRRAKKVPVVIRVAPKAGTGRTAPHKLTIINKAKRRR